MSLNKILVAEDDEINRFLLQQQLKKLGFDSLIVNDGAEAVQAFREGQFLAVLMDLYMPKLNGIEAAGQIRQLEIEAQRDRVPILALTSDDEEETYKNCIAAGIDGVLIKPVLINALSDKLMKVLSR